MTLTLRACTQYDLTSLKEISIETFKDTFAAQNKVENVEAYLNRAYTDEQLTQELAQKDSQFFFVYDDEQLAGYIKVNVNAAQSEQMSDDSLEVERIYVRPDFKRRGIGKYMLEQAITIAKEKKKSQVWLGVWEKNMNALAFYQKMGFVQIDAHSFYMGDDEQTDFIMKKMID